MFLQGDFVTSVMFHEFVSIQETRFVIVMVNDNWSSDFLAYDKRKFPQCIRVDKYNDWLAISKRTIQITVITVVRILEFVSLIISSLANGNYLIFN